jgi:outer membrane protein assembly factor BamB
MSAHAPPLTLRTPLWLILALVTGPVQADWPAWRGIASSGSFSTGVFPDHLDPQLSRWCVPLPGKGCSTPIVSGGVIYVTAPIDGRDALLAFDRQGSELWRTAFGRQDAGKHRNASGSNASPITDGDAVFAYFKSGSFVAVELDGSVRWEQNLVEQYGEVNLFWDHGTSPILTSRHIVMARMHAGDSWLAAFDKSTGDLVWKSDRNYQTPVECDQGYTTPVVIEHEGAEAILTWGAEHITLHAADDGRLLWSCGNFNPNQNQLWPAIASPVVVDDMVVVAYGRNDRGQPLLFGVRLDGSGDVTETNHVWKREDLGTFVPTPIVHQGRVVIVGDQGEVEAIDPKSGKTLWKGELPRSRAKFYASPLIAGDRLYAAREDGKLFVASIADERFELLAESDMGQPVIGSPVPLSDAILIRGEETLCCIASDASS